MNQNDKDAIQNLGILLFKEARYEDALPFFERLYKLNPTPSSTLNFASCLSQVGDLKRATQLWRAYLQQNPRRNDVRVELANALWQMGDKEGSRSQYASVLAAEPNNVQAMNGLGLYYYGADRLKDAEGLFRRAIASKKSYLPPYNNLAVTLERMNKRPEAIRLLEAALKMNPDYAEAKKNLERMRSAG
jgi:protein O-mannosyl-transferase